MEKWYGVGRGRACKGGMVRKGERKEGRETREEMVGVCVCKRGTEVKIKERKWGGGEREGKGGRETEKDRERQRETMNVRCFKTCKNKENRRKDTEQ